MEEEPTLYRCKYLSYKQICLNDMKIEKKQIENEAKNHRSV